MYEPLINEQEKEETENDRYGDDEYSSDSDSDILEEFSANDNSEKRKMDIDLRIFLKTLRELSYPNDLIKYGYQKCIEDCELLKDYKGPVAIHFCHLGRTKYIFERILLSLYLKKLITEHFYKIQKSICIVVSSDYKYDHKNNFTHIKYVGGAEHFADWLNNLEEAFHGGVDWYKNNYPMKPEDYDDYKRVLHECDSICKGGV